MSWWGPSPTSAMTGSKVIRESVFGDYSCTDRCSMDKYFAEKTCLACPENCARCNTNGSLCLECASGSSLFKTLDGQCIPCSAFFGLYNRVIDPGNLAYFNDSYFKLVREPFCSKALILDLDLHSEVVSLKFAESIFTRWVSLSKQQQSLHQR